MKKNILFALIALIAFAPSSFAQRKNTKSKDNTVVLYITRHGKTILNTTDRVQGWTARIVLNTKGQPDMPLTEVLELRETNFGSYEGEYNNVMRKDAALYLHYKNFKELSDAMREKPEIRVDYMNAIKALETLGIGEGYYDVKNRGQKALREIAETEAQKGGGNILVVGHGMSIGIFLSDLDSFGKTPHQAHMSNAAVCKVIYKDGKITLESFGDMSYVEKGQEIAERVDFSLQSFGPLRKTL